MGAAEGTDTRRQRWSQKSGQSLARRTGGCEGLRMKIQPLATLRLSDHVQLRAWPLGHGGSWHHRALAWKPCRLACGLCFILGSVPCPAEGRLVPGPQEVSVGARRGSTPRSPSGLTLTGELVSLSAHNWGSPAASVSLGPPSHVGPLFAHAPLPPALLHCCARPEVGGCGLAITISCPK